jgi:tetratricopeptide (TPR) repeat protein
MQILSKFRGKRPSGPHFLLWAVLILACQDSFAQNGDSATYYLRQGISEKQNGRRLASLKQFEKAIAFDSSNQEILRELASAYLELRRHDRAIKTYKKLVALGDQSAENYRVLLELSFTYNQKDDVLLYAGLLKQKDPAARTSYYVGKVHYDNENYGEAIKVLNQAATEDATNAEVPYLIAHCYTDMENYKQAIPYFQKAVQLDSTKPYWLYEMGLVYFSLNDDKNALRYILEAGNKGLKKDNAYMENLGNAYLNAGHLEEGVAIMQDVLKRKPSDITVLNTVAEAYYNKGKYQEAIDYWDKILEFDKQNASALYMIGMSFQKKGEKEKGQQLCDKAIEMDPSLQHLRQKKSMPGM